MPYGSLLLLQDNISLPIIKLVPVSVEAQIGPKMLPEYAVYCIQNLVWFSGSTETLW